MARHEKMEEFEAGPGVEFGALVAEEGARYSLPVDVADEKLDPRGIAMVEAWSLPAPARRGEDEFKIRAVQIAKTQGRRLPHAHGGLTVFIFRLFSGCFWRRFWGAVVVWHHHIGSHAQS